ncbi:MAG: hypothetical protein EON54_25665 [Alcaligenaceae bacterium]|nr:MAG: hypothetical protein EON54_25665 [Alcaligenaceae bacterium]
MTGISFRPSDGQMRVIEEANRRAEEAVLGVRRAPDELVQRMSQEGQGVFAMSQVKLEKPMLNRPTLFLDLDDVLALSQRYRDLAVQHAMASPEIAPKDLYEKVFSPQAVHALNELIREFDPRVVLTTSWLSLLCRESFILLFERTGVSITLESLHPHWAVAQSEGISRHEAIDRWLECHHDGEPMVVLDDFASGEGLVDGLWHQAGRVVLCDVGVGFNSTLLLEAREALRMPFNRMQPWHR